MSMEKRGPITVKVLNIYIYKTQYIYIYLVATATSGFSILVGTTTRDF